MKSPTRNRYFSLLGLIIFFFSFFNLATSSPLPEFPAHLVARQEPITKERYTKFLEKYFLNTDKYLFFTGNSYDQVENFMNANRGAGYESYRTMFDGPRWADFFNEDDDSDDGEAASEAMAVRASGEVLVFGGVEWKNWPGSVWRSHEIPALKKGLADKTVKHINHVIKDATKPSEVLATDDGDGKMTWISGHHEGETNASECKASKRGLHSLASRDECEAPEQKPPPPPPKPKGEPKSLQIISVLVLCESPSCDSKSWKFMEGTPGMGVDSCGKGIRKDVQLDGKHFDDKFPGGEWTMRFVGYAEDCIYQGLGEKRPGGDVGWLHCPERPAIKCIESPGYNSGDGERNKCESIQVAHCDWE
ncbi:hypothetical protein HBH68_219580 [Parastagonospora nodorum]|nr:hypothetical protein HBH68_219580 [Parastagonospora nodorum]KAH6195608.1 hypothetical protein HBI15_221890 [Parastagonospora nodorum]